MILAFDFGALPEDVKIFLVISLIAFTGAVLLVLFLFASRVFKNERIAREMNLRNRFQVSLNMIMLIEGTDAVQLSSSQFYIKDLRKDMGNSSLAKQVMIDQLIGLQKNISGSSA